MMVTITITLLFVVCDGENSGHTQYNGGNPTESKGPTQNKPPRLSKPPTETVPSFPLLFCSVPSFPFDKTSTPNGPLLIRVRRRRRRLWFAPPRQRPRPCSATPGASTCSHAHFVAAANQRHSALRARLLVLPNRRPRCVRCPQASEAVRRRIAQIRRRLARLRVVRTTRTAF